MSTSADKTPPSPTRTAVANFLLAKLQEVITEHRHLSQADSDDKIHAWLDGQPEVLETLCCAGAVDLSVLNAEEARHLWNAVKARHPDRLDDVLTNLIGKYQESDFIDGAIDTLSPLDSTGRDIYFRRVERWKDATLKREPNTNTTEILESHFRGVLNKIIHIYINNPPGWTHNAKVLSDAVRELSEVSGKLSIQWTLERALFQMCTHSDLLGAAGAYQKIHSIGVLTACLVDMGVNLENVCRPLEEVRSYDVHPNHPNLLHQVAWLRIKQGARVFDEELAAGDPAVNLLIDIGADWRKALGDDAQPEVKNTIRQHPAVRRALFGETAERCEGRVSAKVKSKI